ncbi:MAG: right-handed parallel beta-helix repeat-containing protein [Armatimonadota bacterium]
MSALGASAALLVTASLLSGLCCGHAAIGTETTASGRMIYVSPCGEPGALGTADAPLASVQEALDRAVAGDTVHLRPGVYRERVSFRHSGEYLRPVTLEGEPGAILDGSEPVTLHWEPRPETGPDVYAAPAPFWPVVDRVPEAYDAYVPGTPFFPFTVTADGKIVTALNERRSSPPDQEDPKWHWPHLFRNGVGPYRARDNATPWEGVKALVMYRRQERELLIRFADGRDPNAVEITVSPMDPIITIQGLDRCVVRGLTIRNGAKGVYIEDSLGSVVERCTIGPADFGVMLRTGADRCTIRFNEIFMNPYAGSGRWFKGSWDNWLAMKVGGFSDRDGILMLSSRGGHQIHDNYIHDHWDGIEDWVYDEEQPGDHNLNIHHNRIAKCSDDGLEPNGEEVNCEWHDNLIEDVPCAFRMKAPRFGPIYAYRNIFLNNGEDYRFFGEKPQRPAHVYVYHNTSTASFGISSIGVTGVGTPNYHVYNNLFWCGLAQSVDGSSSPPNWTSDYNVYVHRADDEWAGWWWDSKKEVTDRHQDGHSRWVEEGAPGFRDFARQDLSLTPNSPARATGTDLSKLLDRPLPGCPPGYFQGAAPDVGALQFGEPMPRLPRRSDEVECPPAGSWPEPPRG